MEKITDIKENLQVKEIFKKGRTIISVLDDDKEILLSDILMIIILWLTQEDVWLIKYHLT